MAKNYEIKIWSQPSLYQPEDRQLNIYFSEPEHEANSQTGILLLVAGYGGHSQSNVFKKMRMQFADSYNLVVVQCDYFGYEYMQANKPISASVDKMQVVTNQGVFPMSKVDSHDDEYQVHVPLGESLANFNDMGIVQAMDNLIAVRVVTDILTDNGVCWNKDKVIAYGFSHGAYLCHLCNIFMPKLFSAVIDNSSYLLPYYMFCNRAIHTPTVADGTAAILVTWIYEYMIKHMNIDKEIYMLEILYKHVKNKAKIIAFHGVDDFMTDVEIKLNLYKNIENAECIIIDSSRVDNKVFFSTKHGLKADFLNLFEYVINNYSVEWCAGEFTQSMIQTNACVYNISMESGIPLMRQT